MTQGVVLLAFGKANYMYMAAHLAMSIKYHSPDVQIAIVCDGFINHLSPEWRSFFDQEIQMKKEHYILNHKIDPGMAKIQLLKYLPFDKNIYFDVDALCIQDITPLFEIEGFYKTIVTGRGGYEDKINYAFWATNEVIWDFYGLDKEKGQYSAIQTSFALYTKGKELDAYYDKLVDNFNAFDMKNLQNHWGGTMPDELIFAGTAAQMNHDPDCGRDVVFFGHKLDKRKQAELSQVYYILAIYGPGGNRPLVRPRYSEWYDRALINYARNFKLYPLDKFSGLTRNKHANK